MNTLRLIRIAVAAFVLAVTTYVAYASVPCACRSAVPPEPPPELLNPTGSDQCPPHPPTSPSNGACDGVPIDGECVTSSISYDPTGYEYNETVHPETGEPVCERGDQLDTGRQPLSYQDCQDTP